MAIGRIAKNHDIIESSPAGTTYRIIFRKSISRGIEENNKK